LGSSIEALDSAPAAIIPLAISNPLIIFSMFFRSLAEVGPPPALLAALLLTVDETDDGVGDGDRW
jgi:hypothetical protein